MLGKKILLIETMDTNLLRYFITVCSKAQLFKSNYEMETSNFTGQMLDGPWRIRNTRWKYSPIKEKQPGIFHIINISVMKLHVHIENAVY